jgi:predicted lactoylglutathione lyase
MIITPIRLGAWNRAVGQIASCRLLLAAHSPVKGENMAMKIFVNLPVKNLNRSVEFFSKLGFSFDKQYTDETATCMVVSEEIFVMLLTEEKFQTFTPKQICDAAKFTEVLLCLSLESRAKVNEMVAQAVAGGGSTYNDPQDHGFMYAHGFQDLDGHIWELIYMEPTAVKEPHQGD